MTNLQLFLLGFITAQGVSLFAMAWVMAWATQDSSEYEDGWDV